MPDWKSCEGEVVDAKYPLEWFAGGDKTSAVFLTRFDSSRAAIRLARADPARTASMIREWNRVKLLRHPHLLEHYDAGTSTLAAAPGAYLVMEYAEETLAETLRDRALTADETREMAAQVAEALAYLHGRGMTHGNLKPSNVFAVGSTVKLSSETIARGDPAEDIRALGATVVEALTQRSGTLADDASAAAANLPAPFDKIVNGCLNPDPVFRWPAERVLAWLRPPQESKPPISAAPPRPIASRAAAGPPLRRFLVPAGLVAAALLVVAGITMRRPATSTLVAGHTPPPTPAAVAPDPPPAKTVDPPKAAPPVRPNPEAQSTRDRLAAEDGIARRVLPNVPAKARETITGRPAVVVRVTVDPSGNVTNAVVERTFSPYFSKFAVDAARQWQFVSDDRAGAREWLLRFVFTQSKTDAVARRAPAK